jgi:hypothetical protein
LRWNGGILALVVGCVAHIPPSFGLTWWNIRLCGACKSTSMRVIRFSTHATVCALVGIYMASKMQGLNYRKGGEGETSGINYVFHLRSPSHRHFKQGLPRNYPRVTQHRLHNIAPNPSSLKRRSSIGREAYSLINPSRIEYG